MILVLDLFVDDGIYHRDWDKERRLEVVSERDKVAGPPLHRREAIVWLLSHRKQLRLLPPEGDVDGWPVLA